MGAACVRGDDEDADAVPSLIVPQSSFSIGHGAVSSWPPLPWWKNGGSLLPGSQAIQNRQVMLNIYDVGTSHIGRGINNFLRPLGTGVFHCGVEVYAREWSYSDTLEETDEERAETGVFCSVPRDCEGHSFIEAIPMGMAIISGEDVFRLLQWIKVDWPVDAYHTLRHNCCHFCDEFCQRLGVGPIPEWVRSLAGAGAAIADSSSALCCLSEGNGVCCTNRESTAVEYVDAVPPLVVQL